VVRDYNFIAGHSLERLAALSDGVFAIAMTLLVLDLRVPEVINKTKEVFISAPVWISPQMAPTGEVISHDEWWGLLLRFIPYLMSFMTLGIFWVGQQTQFNYFTRTDRNLTWIHLGFLLVVTLLPFSTSLLATFMAYRFAVIIYWLNMVLLGSMLYISLHYARRYEMMKENTHAECYHLQKRIVLAQMFYGSGMLFCFINTYLGVVLILLVQLFYISGLRIPTRRLRWANPL
jgi:uncharacterized membrane protein